MDGLLRVADLVPSEQGGALVVGALLDDCVVSLAERVPSTAHPIPLTTRGWMGRDVFRRSAGLLFLEAAARAGRGDLAIGPSVTTGRIIATARPPSADEARAIVEHMTALVQVDAPFVEETLPIDVAIACFQRQGWSEAVALLGSWRDPSVQVVRCGEVRALRRGAFVPSARWLAGVSLAPHPQGVLLDWGPAIRDVLPSRPVPTVMLEQRAPSFGAEMSRAQQRWLELLQVSSVGAFNEACIAGRLAELVRVSEGFHEKHIAATADEVRARGDVRIVAVAGPSSSGKTTFIKRLVVQLQVEGIRPVELSLDDYYRDRESIPIDAEGRQDFEGLDALDLPLLDDHLRRLVAGERVRTARFDFVAGRSHPEGGRELALGPRDALLVEGIHALDPGAFALEDVGMYRVFVNVATSLPFDHLSSLEAADMRLVRRIVRDRHRRGTTTAQSLERWDSVRRAERLQILPFQANADRVFDSSLVYETAVLKVFAERYLLEVPRHHPQRAAADRLRRLLDPVLPVYPDHVPPTSILREFIGASGFSY